VREVFVTYCRSRADERIDAAYVIGLLSALM
jgi:hypothetical protein